MRLAAVDEFGLPVKDLLDATVDDLVPRPVDVGLVYAGVLVHADQELVSRLQATRP